MSVEVSLLQDKLLGPGGDFIQPFDVILESIMAPQPDGEWFKTRYAKAQERIDELRALREAEAQHVAERFCDFYSIDSVSFTLPLGIEHEWLVKPRVTATYILGE